MAHNLGWWPAVPKMICSWTLWRVCNLWSPTIIKIAFVEIWGRLFCVIIFLTQSIHMTLFGNKNESEWKRKIDHNYFALMNENFELWGQRGYAPHSVKMISFIFKTDYLPFLFYHHFSVLLKFDPLFLYILLPYQADP